MAAAPLRVVRTCALTSVVLLLGALPAWAIAQAPALSAGCVEGAGGIVTCTYTSPTAAPIIVDVPDGVASATMTLRGGAGGAGAAVLVFQELTVIETPGGAGGTAHAVLPVDDDRNLEVRVGGAGQAGFFNNDIGGAGGIGGVPGGNGSALAGSEAPPLLGGGGGGGTEVRVAGSGDPTTTNPLIAAGGGGGGGSGLPFLTEVVPGGPGTGGAGGGAEGGDAPPFVPDEQQVFGLATGGQGGTQTEGGAGGSVVPPIPFPAVGAAGTRGAGGDAPTGPFGEAPVFTGSGAGGGGGGYFGGGAGSFLTGGGGGSGFGPEGTGFGVGPTGPFTEAALPDGEAVIVFAAPVPEDEDEDDEETGAGGQDPCANVTRVLISDRMPLSC